jgi:hypothetical protein
MRGGDLVPDAPFKTTWPDVALKRSIRDAAEGGYDALSCPVAAHKLGVSDGLSAGNAACSTLAGELPL